MEAICGSIIVVAMAVLYGLFHREPKRRELTPEESARIDRINDEIRGLK